MLKKVKPLVLTTLTVLLGTLILPGQSMVDAKQVHSVASETELDDNAVYLELSSENGISNNDADELLTEIGANPYEIRATFEFDGMEITFGVTNTRNLSTDEFRKQIEQGLRDAIKDYSKSENSKTVSLSDAKKNLKYQFITFLDTEDKIKAQINNLDKQNKLLSKGDKNLKVKEVHKKDRDKMLKEMQEKLKHKKDEEIEGKKIEKYAFTDEELAYMKEVIASKPSKQKEVSKQNEATGKLLGIQAIGGPSYNTGKCDPESINPRCGDGQDRMRLDNRFNESGQVYNWLPYYTSAKVWEYDSDWDERRVRIDFKWEQEALDNLNLDSNESIEIEALFYNYGDDVGIPENGWAYMRDKGSYWSTNLPGGYNDTTFLDSEDEKSFTVGTTHTDDLDAGVNYYFVMNGFPQNYQTPTEGLYVVDYQRGYWFDSENVAFRAVRGSGDEWYVFNEEYENTMKVKQYHKYDSSNYAPGQYVHYTKENFYDLFRYKDSFSTAHDDGDARVATATEDGYKVLKLQVNNSGNFTFETSKYTGDSSTYDTVLQLYDQNFDLVAENDDYGDSYYSRISEYLDEGDYYVVIHGYNYKYAKCYLTIN